MRRIENSLDSKQVLSVIERYSVALDILDDKEMPLFCQDYFIWYISE